MTSTSTSIEHAKNTEDDPSDLRNSHIKLTLSIYEPIGDTEHGGEPGLSGDGLGSGKQETSQSPQSINGKRVIYRLEQPIGGGGPAHHDSELRDDQDRPREMVMMKSHPMDEKKTNDSVSSSSERTQPEDNFNDDKRIFEIKDLIDSIKNLRSSTNQRLTDLISQENFKRFEPLKEKLVNQQLSTTTIANTDRSRRDQDNHLDEEDEDEEEEEDPEGEEGQ